jgi:hypothetical protein
MNNKRKMKKKKVYKKKKKKKTRCHGSLRILPDTMPPASRNQLKRPMLHPNS